MAKIDLQMKQIIKKLQKVEPKLQKSVLGLAVKSGAKVVQDNARGNVQSELSDGKHQGVVKGSRKSKEHSAEDLKHNIIIRKKTISKTRKDGQAGSTVYRIGIKLDGRAWFAHIVEFGSKLHPARPFMTPALEQSGSEALRAVSGYIKKRFNTLVKKGAL